MVAFTSFTVSLCMVASATTTAAEVEPLRASAQRLRHPDDSLVQSLSKLLPSQVRAVDDEKPYDLLKELASQKEVIDTALTEEKNQLDALFESFNGLDSILSINTLMPTPPLGSVTAAPSDYPSVVPSSGSPLPFPTTSDFPSSVPSAFPTVGVLPSSVPTAVVGAPTVAPTSVLTAVPTGKPSSAPSSTATTSPSSAPSVQASAAPTTAAITLAPSTAPSNPPLTFSPTFAACGMTEAERIARIYQILDSVADPLAIRNTTTPQGSAAAWIIEHDGKHVCPDDPKLIQRWAMAVFYNTAGGDEWIHCSGNPNATDDCGNEDPFVGKQRWLSNSSECDWAAVSCVMGCVTEIEFELNNLAGRIPTEMGLLTKLAVWGMEQGQLTGPIPTEIGRLTDLIFIDFDFNNLTGSLPSELFTLTRLTQLDINNNMFTGSINGIGVFPDMEFMQLHANDFTGTVPEAVGDYSHLYAFTIHETSISGTMPAGLCDLLPSAGNGGNLTYLIADCKLPNPDIICNCCTDCRRA